MAKPTGLHCQVPASSLRRLGRSSLAQLLGAPSPSPPQPPRSGVGGRGHNENSFTAGQPRLVELGCGVGSNAEEGREVLAQS
ncbi:hypothetical protein GUJ93_ZPchr0007g6341 [Zizania palustris]|uniref:Uncharacterized protein n=1 Tax=Zizania palustris TaxID=103762 RepID=A0A8J5SSD5_ZIZPA|nr:hypothetical protein GUJ93_ZPchr0007g6341 [Zizania palustris]